MSDAALGSQPWYRSLNRSQWNTLIAANLGWLFDGYETYALVISVGVGAPPVARSVAVSRKSRSMPAR